MNLESINSVLENLETKAELIKFGEEVLGLEFKSRDTVEEIRARITAFSSAQVQTQEPEPQPEPAAEPELTKAKAGRRLKNTKNGRVLGYTEQLAKLKHMKEI